MQMKRILTGIQSSGTPHLGNLLGSILPAVSFSQQSSSPCLYFIADLHSLTTITDAEERKKYTLSVAAAWMACGLDTQHHLLYRQSQIPQVCELSWYLSCYTPYPMLANAHGFKAQINNLSQVSAGLFSYPVLMAADILLYQATEVPVGPDQAQHLEITRDIGSSFNHKHGPVFNLPVAAISSSEKAEIPGTDGQKMSKSQANTLDIFLPPDHLRRQVMRIPTDSLPLASPKDPDQCLVYRLYSSFASSQESQALRQLYLKGGYGYSSAKESLLDLLLNKFAKERASYASLILQPQLIEKTLQKGEAQAQAIAQETLNKVRKMLGFS